MISDFMAQALTRAESVIGTTSPNPAVGCVIVRDGRVIATGATEPPPGKHAEVLALQAAGTAARGATAYVTLEPHSFVGRTRPCTDALIAAGVATVHVAMLDPNPKVAGAGVHQLQEAGVEVTVGDGATEAGRLIEAYVTHQTTGLPFVIAKFAATLDGKIAAASGDSRWIAGEVARAWGHAFRTRIDAILCGVNNVLLDDPQLTARPNGVLASRQPLRIVADSRGRTPANAAVLRKPDRADVIGGATLIATTDASPQTWRSAIEATGAEIAVLPADAGGRVNLNALLVLLGKRDVLSLLVEGGGVLHGSMFAAGLVDKVHAIIAPKIVGGDAYPAVAGRGAARMADAITLRDVEIVPLGSDVAFVGYVRPRR